MMEFAKLEENLFGIIVGADVLAMSREEAEDLFVQIGHVLQDDDIQKYASEGE